MGLELHAGPAGHARLNCGRCGWPSFAAGELLHIGSQVVFRNGLLCPQLGKRVWSSMPPSQPNHLGQAVPGDLRAHSGCVVSLLHCCMAQCSVSCRFQAGCKASSRPSRRKPIWFISFSCSTSLFRVAMIPGVCYLIPHLKAGQSVQDWGHSARVSSGPDRRPFTFDVCESQNAMGSW